MSIPIIDIFAGPGGLGEGFSQLKDKEGKRFFDIKLSIEKEVNAHKTLELRSFFRQFSPDRDVPKEYYDLLKIEDEKERIAFREKLFNVLYPKEGRRARKEAWQVTLGVEDPKEIDHRIKKGLKGEKDWVLIGGPPCQAYSLAGRSRVGGIHEDDHRVFLYKEYLRVIAMHKPAVFVMENVKGLLSAKVRDESIFHKIHEDLTQPGIAFGVECPGYKVYSLVNHPDRIDDSGNPVYQNPKDFLIKSEKYGIPQTRHRVILLGVREDVDSGWTYILKEEDPVSVKDVIGTLPKLRSGLSRTIDSIRVVDGKSKVKYRNLIDSSDAWRNVVTSTIREVSDKKKAPSVEIPVNGRGRPFIKGKVILKGNPLKRWYRDENLEGVCNHETRAHMPEDLKRYFFLSLHAKENGFSLKMDEEDFLEKYLPKHKNAKSGKFTDRFRVQVANAPGTTVTSHISKDGHYFIHYDPYQCRSLTVREAARIQTFPDNYFFWGSRTAQYVQVGNAVPPLLANKIAKIVKTLF
jgi:DNA (cytosine-5)-methyltransferase 1